MESEQLKNDTQRRSETGTTSCCYHKNFLCDPPVAGKYVDREVAGRAGENALTPIFEYCIE
jgi:hypothetical protein